MDEVYTHFPKIYTFLMFFYGSPTPTFFQKDTGETKVIFSEEGVQQGDVMGPALFCIGLKPVLDRLSNRLREQHRSKSTFIGAFMDDVGLIFPSGGLSRAWVAAEEEFRSFNLKLNLGKDKSLAFSPAWVETERCPKTSHAGLKLSKDGFKLGGGAIGKCEYKKKHFEEVRDEAVGLASKVANYRDPQGGWLLFRFYVLPKLGFLLCLMADAIPTSMWQAADDMLLKKCTRGLGIAENEWTLHQTVQASLPLSQRGLGIHRYSLMQKCALVGCYASCLADVLKRLLVQRYANNPDEMWKKVSREGWSQKAQEAFYRLQNDHQNAVSGAPERSLLKASWRDCTEAWRGEGAKGVQGRLYDTLQAATRKRLLGELPGSSHPTLETPPSLDEKGQICLRSCSGNGASAWLGAIPFDSNHKIFPPLFRTAMRVRLGLRIPELVRQPVFAAADRGGTWRVFMEENVQREEVRGEGTKRLGQHFLSC
uniref:Reverse transcriptase domain-containing protein n=1 Tax=Chromera velia CCMP2878 TaxID=1169474 RepID=A0A0G4I397_9ALVE|eukprot:Cvel_10591.t1-p1 / transcript=Cvel_10591.t1 / gene=Cvel_10591 / organism=Chromera_velia_CCMP2878 / gene_product=hypothetical protein / transcript_product=hypothetical protein / location=Cvel_scaffold642:39713-41152(+) / protein_length=480 / sequence_SO=supercontig / SO=protein_coding / is_pseudo=false